MYDTIQSPNSSGQGFCPAHAGHPYHGTAISFGYRYSHSTPVKYRDGRTLIWHTYKHGEHTLSFADVGGFYHSWATSVSTASGRQTTGITQPQLARHLANKRRRYAELRG